MNSERSANPHRPGCLAAQTGGPLTHIKTALPGSRQNAHMKRIRYLTITTCCAALLALPACNDSNGKATLTSGEPKPAAEPFTGSVHEVKMRGTVAPAPAFFFEPAELTIKQGDKVKFTLVDGAPHNVSFNSPMPGLTKIPDGAKLILENRGQLVGTLLQVPGQTAEIIFGKDLPVGEYTFVCDPHAPLGMKGKITLNP
jgi:plastocyanin